MPVKVPALTVITDNSRFSGEPFFDTVDSALKGGVDAVLVREKDMDSARLLAFASRLRQLTHQHGAKLIIHSQADIASAVGADGVHVAAEGIDHIPSIRLWLNDAEKTVSASCHNLDEIKQAEAAGADYIFLSPVFPTDSHPGAPCLGPEKFQQLVELTKLPVVALGGICRENRGQLHVNGCAVIGAILSASQPAAMAKELL
ncbi:thiamine-phosphate pyrophosphorylase [Mariprofundus micogutta]|uniref:Thiamine-phosphate pyrophosphorylase n=1 Tax=Mariprofundus micogutta TaxID=1921010 RepID=A0A1L8CMB0_9PROT|nr:thiamine phosphate synthase [Mariprofundus micogutta]GAV20048.1 thiamine-phosphate pyrophosphorylase [Mariprofundus micogutta]